jgi:hypothetical protein
MQWGEIWVEIENTQESLDVPESGHVAHILEDVEGGKCSCF